LPTACFITPLLHPPAFLHSTLASILPSPPRPPPCPTLFPYTTLFRSILAGHPALDSRQGDRRHYGPERRAAPVHPDRPANPDRRDRKSTRLNSSHVKISYAVFCLNKKMKKKRKAGQTTEIKKPDDRMY